MEEWFSRFFQNLQLQLGLRDPKLTAPEKNISGIFLETDTGENIDILLVGKDGCAEELRGRTPAEELVRFTSLDFAELPCATQDNQLTTLTAQKQAHHPILLSPWGR